MCENIFQNYKTYTNSFELSGALFKMNGIVLSYQEKTDQIKYGIERMLTIVHNEYSNNMINASVPITDPPFLLRLNLADGFGIIARRHFELVVEKVRQILNGIYLS